MYMHDCFFLLSAVHLLQLLSQLQRVLLSFFLFLLFKIFLSFFFHSFFFYLKRSRPFVYDCMRKLSRGRGGDCYPCVLHSLVLACTCVERLDEVGVLLGHDLALELEGWSEIACLLGEVYGQPGPLLHDLCIAGGLLVGGFHAYDFEENKQWKEKVRRRRREKKNSLR